MSIKVSVCLPTYNCAPYVAEAIESVLGQSYSDFELIIIDNCSTDDTRQIVGTYADRDSRVRLLKNPQNIGMVNNWNRCLQEAQGEYIKFLFGDDLLSSSSALQKMVSVLDKDRSLALVASARFVIDSGSTIVKLLSRYGNRDIIMPGTDVVRDCLLEQRNFIGEPSVVLFRREQGKRGFDGRYRQFVDLEMWMHLLEQGAFAYLHEPLCSFRTHDRQATAENLDANVHIDDQVLLAEVYAHRPYLSFSSWERAYLRSVPAMSYWKLSRRHGKMSRETAQTRIQALYQGKFFRFYLFFPIHRIFKLYQTVRRRLMIKTRKRLIL